MTYPEYSGYQFQYFSSDDSDSQFTWKIWDIDGENIYLISNSCTLNVLSLRASTGYNNGVTLLDNICDRLFADPITYPGMTGRNLKLSDIANERVLKTADLSQNTNYNLPGDDKGNQKLCPWAEIEDLSNATSLYQRSIAYNLLSPNSSDPEPQTFRTGAVYDTRWNRTISNKTNFKPINEDDGSTLYNLVLGNEVWTNRRADYWLGTRYSQPTSNYGVNYFGCERVCKTGVDFLPIANANYYTMGSNTPFSAIRPVLVLPLSSCVILENGDSYDIMPRPTR